MDSNRKSTVRTAGGAWGPQRVALGLSLRELAKLSGVNHVTLALAEQGRLIPTGDEYQKVMGALTAAGASASAASLRPAQGEPA
jgi:transcriptional regulator with XRE-family HTH domain